MATLFQRMGDAVGSGLRRDLVVAMAAAWLAFMAGLLADGAVEDGGSFAIAAVGGAALVFLGFAAASRCRLVPQHANLERMRLAVLSLAAGTGLGLANLAANWAIAQSDPRLHALLVARFKTLAARVALEPQGLVGSPLAEEVALRLFLMSVLAWAVSRFTKRAGLVFAIALAGSSLFFALLHLARPFPGDPSLANFYRMTLVAKYTLAGMPLAWIFWRWGLPYSILCHVAANAAHLAVQGLVFY